MKERFLSVASGAVAALIILLLVVLAFVLSAAFAGWWIRIVTLYAS